MAKFVLTAQLQLQAPKNLRTIVNQINSQLKGLKTSINVNVKPNQIRTLNQVSNSLKNVSKQGKQATSIIEKFGKDAALASKRFAAFVSATFAIRGLTRLFKDAFGEALKFERELIKIAQVTDRSVKSLGGLTKEITRLSTEFGVSSQELVKVSRILSQTGLDASKVKIALQALAKADLAPTFENITKTAEGAIAVFRQFGVEAKDLERVLGSINAVAGKFAVESGDLITAVRRTGGAFAAAGGELNELIALFTSVRATTRESAESIATGFRTIFTRLQRTRTINFLDSLGIQLRDAQGQFVGPIKAIERLSQALKDVRSTDPRFSRIIEELGGFRQVSKVIPLIQQFETAQRALNVANAGGESLTRDAIKAQDALAIQISKVREEFNKLIRAVANNEAFRSMVTLSLRLAEALLKVGEALTPILPLLAAGGLAIGAAGIGKFARGFGGVFKGGSGGVKGFARGGFVPGSGNGDTVPAMLEPGEFVLRKSAVKSLGASNVAGLNKFAAGGLVNQNKVGFAILEQGNPSDFPVGVGGKTFQVIREGLGPDNFNQFNSTLNRGIINSVTGVASDLSDSPISIRAGDEARFLRSINTGVRGNLFEDTLRMISQRGVFAKDFNPLASFDFTNGLSGRLIDDYKQLVGIKYIDAKASRGEASRASITGKITRQLEREVPKTAKAATKAQIISKGATYRNILSTDKELAGKITEKLSGINQSRLASFLSGSRVSGGKAALLSSVQKAGKDIGIDIKELASGGSVDSVPALLTPGEFVINKKSAAAIGKGTLNRLNKVEKFQRGGFVGGAGAGQGLATPLLLAGLAGNLVSTFDNLNDEVGKTVGFISQFAVQLGVVIPLLSSFRQSSIGQTIGGFAGADLGASKIAQQRRLSTADKRVFALLRREQRQLEATSSPLLPGQATPVREQRRRLLLDRRAKRLALGRPEARAKLGRGIALGGAVAGTLATVAGQAIGGVTGATISGAGTGATIGAAFGPIGLAVGTAVGGLLSFASASKRAAEELRRNKFNAEIEKLGNTLARLQAGALTPVEAVGGVRRGIGVLRERLVGATSREDIAAANVAVSKSVPQIRSFLSNLIKTEKSINSFGDVIRIVDRETLRRFANLSNISLEKLQRSIEEEIKTRNQSIKVNNLLIQAEQERSKRLQAIEDFSSALGAATNAAREFDAAITDISNLANLTTLSGVRGDVNILRNPRFGQGFGTAVRRTTGLLGPSANVLGNQAQLFRQISGSLVRTVIQASQANALGRQGGFIDAFENIINRRLGAGARTPGGVNLVSDLVATLRRVQGPGGDPSRLIEAARDPIGLAKQLRSSIQPVLDVLAEAADQIDAQFNNLIKGLDQRRKINLQISQEVTKLFGIERKRREFFDRFFERPTDVADARRFNVGVQREILGRDAGLGSNVGAIAAQLRESQFNVLNLTTRINDARGQNLEGIKRLIQLRDSEAERVQRLTNGLKNLTDVTNRTAAAQKRLGEIRAGRQERFGAASDFVFGGTRGRRDFARSLRNALFLRQGGRVGQIPEGQRESTRAFLRRFQEARIFGGLTGREVERRTVEREFRAAGVDPRKARELALRATTTEEARLLAEINKAFVTAEQAQSALIANLQNVNREFLKQLELKFDKFVRDLRLNLIDRQIKATKEEIDLGKGEIQKAQRGQLLLGQLRGLLGPDVFKGRRIQRRDLAQVSAIGSQALNLSELVKQRGNVGTLRALLTNASVSERDGRATIAGLTLDEFRARIEDLGVSAGLTPEQQRQINLSVSTALRQAKAVGVFTGFQELPDFDDIIGARRGRIAQAREELARQGVSRRVAGFLGTEEGQKRLQALIKGLESFENFNFNKHIQDNTRELQKNNALLAKQQTKRATFSTGGSVTGIGNSDSVPALLTPGEFVINKAAVRSVGVGTLQRMNARRFQGGGRVQDSTVSANGALDSLSLATIDNKDLEGTVNKFSQSSSSLSSALNNFPRNVEHTINGSVEVLINGAEVLTNILPEVQTIIESRVKDGLNKFISEKFPDAGEI